MAAHFEDNYLIIDGAQLKEYGASFGIRDPNEPNTDKNPIHCQEPISFLTLQEDMVLLQAVLPTENYYTIGISLNFYDFWFVKRKYD